MPKMKHLLRKLHIGSGLNEQQRVAQAQPVINPSLTPSPNSNSVPNSVNVTGVESATRSESSSVSSGTMGGIGVVEPVGGGQTAGDEVDFSLLEEEFQMQLALAISASDPETVQIDAAKRISLAGTDTSSFLEFLSLRYWNYNVVNYNEKIVDGFYDVYGIASTLGAQGKMPSLVDLRAVSVLDNVDYQVILVNRLLDPELQELEKRVYNMYVQSQAFGHSPVVSGMIQKIAEMVVNRMGGPVADAEEVLKMWTSRSYELRRSLNSIILPLGRLDIGLSRHRALLFKVLADRINLPCMLVKGSYYTGTDDGAVNLVRINNGSEYIIDLMGAPGALIPAEVPSSHLLNSTLVVRGFAGLTEASQGSCFLLDKGIGSMASSASLDIGSKAGAMRSVEFVSSQTNEDEGYFAGRAVSDRSEQDSGKLLPSAAKSSESISGSYDKPSAAQKRKVKNVSKYVISAAKDPEFAQKLHAVLLESGASPPPDLFMDIKQDLGEQCMSDQVLKGTNVDVTASCHSNELSTNDHCLVSSGMETSEDTNSNLGQKQMAKHQRESEVNAIKTNVASSYNASREGLFLGCTTSDRIQVLESCSTDEFCQMQPKTILAADEKQVQMTSDMDFSEESELERTETARSDLHIVGNDPSGKIYPMPREVSEWEIPWEDLQIGERIGIGSYGEVYRADWNGTEVAVKKFLDQDFSGDALAQFKCEVEIMIRLRHPNVVLFMGAVTRPPHFSILTEYLTWGSLYKLLHRSNHQLDERRRLRMALDVAKGMNYLHTSQPTIVHRDLKTPNLLVDKNWVVKVCDFGLSRSKHHTFLSSKSSCGTPEWMAPEVLRNEPADEKCDVYSFGVILWELVTLQVPWKGLNPMQVVGAVGFQNRHLEIPEHVDPIIAQIIRDCWQKEPHLRPSFGQLMTRLRRLILLYVRRQKNRNQVV